MALTVKVIDKYAEINPILKDGVIVRKDSEIFHLDVALLSRSQSFQYALVESTQVIHLLDLL